MYKGNYVAFILFLQLLIHLAIESLSKIVKYCFDISELLSHIMVFNSGTYTKLLVVGGTHAAHHVELHDLSGDNLQCPDIADHPVEDDTIGVFINDKAMVCGGNEYEDVYVNDCYSYDMQVGF